jgi:hypothetical protein
MISTILAAKADEETDKGDRTTLFAYSPTQVDEPTDAATYPKPRVFTYTLTRQGEGESAKGVRTTTKRRFLPITCEDLGPPARSDAPRFIF